MTDRGAGDSGDSGDAGSGSQATQGGLPSQSTQGRLPAQPPAPPPVPPSAPPPIGLMSPPGPPLPPPAGGFGPPSSSGAPVDWAAPSAVPTGLEVPGAAGLRFARVLHRFLAWVMDAIIVGLTAAIVAGVVGAASRGTSSETAAIYTVIYLGVAFLYFVGLWTSAGRATLGMRVMKLQVGNAFDGRTLTMSQATLRWIGLGLPFQALSLLPGASTAIGGLVILWYLVLLITTAISPTRQGVHDRLAGSAIVQPVGASTPAMACLVLVLLLLVVPVILGFLFLAYTLPMTTILSSVGN